MLTYGFLSVIGCLVERTTTVTHTYTHTQHKKAVQKKSTHTFLIKTIAQRWFYFRQINAIGVFLFWIIIFAPFNSHERPTIHQPNGIFRFRAFTKPDSKQFRILIHFDSIFFFLLPSPSMMYLTKRQTLEHCTICYCICRDISSG